jgi:hypothetical protein
MNNIDLHMNRPTACRSAIAFNGGLAAVRFPGSLGHRPGH